MTTLEGIGTLDICIGFFVASIVVRPFIVLVHELGHAVVALGAARGRVLVHVGIYRPWICVESTRLKVELGPVLLWQGRQRAFCLWDARDASLRRRFAASLGGPVATALLIPCFIAGMLACVGMPDWVVTSWAASAVLALVSVFANVDPRPVDDAERQGSVGRDGPRAIALYRAWRAEKREITH